MKKYSVKLTFKYSDILEVEAENEKDAISKAMDVCEEEFESFYDSSVTETLEQ